MDMRRWTCGKNGAKARDYKCFLEDGLTRVKGRGPQAAASIIGARNRNRRMDTLARIKDLAIKELSLDPAKLDPNAPLADLGIDSLTFIEFMFKIEDEFGVKVSDEDLRSIKCLADLERHVAASAAGRRQGLRRGTAESRRVAVTGIGVVSALGNSLADFRSALAAGRPGVRAPAAGSDARLRRAGGRAHRLGSAPRISRATKPARSTASRSSRWRPPARRSRPAASTWQKADRNRIGVYWGTGMGGANTLETAYSTVYGKNDFRLRPLTVVMAMNNAAGSNVAVKWGLRGPFANFSTACSSSAMAIGEAMRRDPQRARGRGARRRRRGPAHAGHARRLAGAAHARAGGRRRPCGQLQALRQAARRTGARRRRGRADAGRGIARARARRADPRHPHRLRQLPATPCTCPSPTATARCAR